MFYQLLIISLLLGLLLYNTLIVKKKQEKKAIKKTEKKIIKKSKNSIIKKLEKLSKSDEKINKSEFYEQLNKTFREYFDFLWYKDTDLLTLKEIKLLDIDKKLISLFEKSYLNEFNDKKDTQTLRKKIISDLVKIIK